MQNIQLKFKDYLAILLLLFSFSIYFFSDYIVSFLSEMDSTLQNSQKTAGELAKIISSAENIKLDTNVLKSPYLQNLRKLPEYPIDISPSVFGKINPFSGVGGFSSVSNNTATTTVGGLQYAGQRDEGQPSVRTINLPN